MFPLIAITAFFILGIAFFAIGKDDFGIKKVKDVSNDASSKEKGRVKTETSKKNESTKGNEMLISKPLQENEYSSKVSN